MTDTPVDRLLDALRASELNPSPDALGRMVEYVKHNGDRGRIPVTEAISLYLHPVEEWPDQCPGSDVLVMEADCWNGRTVCGAPDCGVRIETYWDGMNWRKCCHNRPLVKS